MAKTGRPNKRDTISLKKVEQLASFGLTDVQIAEVFGVCKATINNYKIKWPDFLDSIKKGKEVSDNQVIKSLFQRACGYEHPETKVFQYEGRLINADVTKHYPPDTAACFIWLKNRLPTEWRDKVDIDHTIKDYLHEDLKDIESHELERMTDELIARRNNSKNGKGTSAQKEG